MKRINMTGHGSMGKLFSKLFGSLKITRIDRYIITKFLSTYIFLIAIIISIAIIFDFNEKIDKITQSHVSIQKVIFDYYLNFVPYFSNQSSVCVHCRDILHFETGRQL